MLIEHTFFLDFTALVHGIHSTQYTAALAESFKFSHHCLLNQVGQGFDDKTPLPGVFTEIEPELTINNQLHSDSSSYRSFCWRGNRLVKSIGMEAITVIKDRIQRLQGSTNIVKAHFLSMQTATTGLNVVLEHLTARAGAVAFTHCSRPNAASNSTTH